MICFETITHFRERLQALMDYKRSVYLVSMIEERVAFLDIYPKRGPLQQLDIPDEELLRLLSLYVQEGNNDQLQFFDIST